jgi:hypothetical protein
VIAHDAPCPPACPERKLTEEKTPSTKEIERPLTELPANVSGGQSGHKNRERNPHMRIKTFQKPLSSRTSSNVASFSKVRKFYVTTRRDLKQTFFAELGQLKVLPPNESQ